MLLIRIAEDSHEPKYRQIIAEIRRGIESGALAPGELLPSTRRLATSLGIHRSTITTAYQELWSLGYVDLTQGARPRVRQRAPVMTTAMAESPDVVDWAGLVSPTGETLLRTYRRFGRRPVAPPGVIDFSRLDMDQRLLPLDTFRGCLNDALLTHGSALLGYGDPAGFAPLRSYIASRLGSHGIAVGPDEILITNGSQQALDLVLRLIAAPGRSVVVEAPTYDCILPLLQLNGLRALPVPLKADGLDLDALRAALAHERPALVYTMPTFQNPTGVSTNQAHRERLLALSEQHAVPLLEDGFDEEMKYFGKVVLPLKSMDQHHSVIYCGTFSKVLLPGIRVGWVAAGRACIERLTAIRRYTDLTSNLVLQAGLHRYCASGAYDRHLNKMHRVFRRRMQAALRALRAELPRALAEWSEPTGGYLIWLRLRSTDEVSTTSDWLPRFAAAGVQLTPGEGFFPPGTLPTDACCFRLSISRLNEDEIVEGVRRLGRAVRQVHGGEEHSE